MTVFFFRAVQRVIVSAISVYKQWVLFAAPPHSLFFPGASVPHFYLLAPLLFYMPTVPGREAKLGSIKTQVNQPVSDAFSQQAVLQASCPAF